MSNDIPLVVDSSLASAINLSTSVASVPPLIFFMLGLLVDLVPSALVDLLHINLIAIYAYGALAA